MAVVVGSATTYSTAANTTTGNLITGDYQFAGRGVYTLAIKASATGMYVTLSVGGINIINDQPVMAFGATGSLSQIDNIMASQLMNGGLVTLKLRNSTAGALTTDYLLSYQPGK